MESGVLRDENRFDFLILIVQTLPRSLSSDVEEMDVFADAGLVELLKLVANTGIGAGYVVIDV
jgi:hypothetical protein